MARWRLTPAKRTDIEALAALENRCFAWPWGRLSFESEFAGRDGGGLVARAAAGNGDEALIAYLFYRLIADEVHIYRIAVSPEWLRQGIGSQLVGECLRRAFLKTPRCISSPHRVGMVFQKANLMPWRTVLGNILLPLEILHVSHQESLDKANSLIELVGLTGFDDSLLRDLSGGMAQRVAIARALIHEPDLLLLDQPFGSLDALNRERMGSELTRIWQARRTTVVLVTHSISESLFLADRVLVLSPRPGRLRLDLTVDLPRPRVEEIRYMPEFSTLARQVRPAIE